MVLRQTADGRGQKLDVLHSIENRYIYQAYQQRFDARASVAFWQTTFVDGNFLTVGS